VVDGHRFVPCATRALSVKSSGVGYNFAMKRPTKVPLKKIKKAQRLPKRCLSSWSLFVTPKSAGTVIRKLDAYFDGRATGRVFDTKGDARAAGFAKPQRVEITVKLV
jgi:hypothetical protein